MDKKRIRIGFFTQAGGRQHQNQMFSGVVEEAQTCDVDIVQFALEFEYSYYRFGNQLELFCGIADNLGLDGILYVGWIGKPGELKTFFQKSLSIPIIALGVEDEDYPSVFQDWIGIFNELISHIVEYHHYRNVFFIVPILEDTRIQVFEKAMKGYGLYNPDYILTAEGMGMGERWDFSERAQRIVDVIFNNRRLKPDAILSMYSEETVCLIEELKARRLKVPDDIAVLSWEDSELCQYNDPEVTAVYFPNYEIGNKGCELLVKHLSGTKIEMKNKVRSKIVIRRSCGCVSASSEKVTGAGSVVGSIVLSSAEFNFETVSSRIAEELKSDLSIVIPEEALLVFYKSLRENNPGHFTVWLENLLCSRHLSVDQLYVIDDDFLIIRRRLKPYFLKNERMNACAEDVWINVQIVIRNWIGKTMGIQERNRSRFTLTIEEMSLDLITSFNMEKIRAILRENLSKIRIPNCFLYRIVNQEQNSLVPKLFFAYQNNAVIYENFRFDSDEESAATIDTETLFQGKRHTYFLHILHVRDTLIGCVFFEYGIEDHWLYLSLSIELSSAIQGALVLERLQKSNAELISAQNEIIKQMDIINLRTLELEESNQKLSVLDNLKNDFIANITHDFRSPLMVILSMADLGMKYDKLADDYIRNRYKIIYGSSLKLKNTIDHLLELAKMDARGIKLNIRRVPVRSFLESISDFYKSAVINSNIRIVTLFPGPELEIYTDLEKLEEAVNNIISNAMKFIDPENGEIVIELKESGESIRIIISDNGIGISPDKLESIFGRFEQIEPGENTKYKGTGIGLAFCRQLINYLKGKIWAESEGLHKGARFVIELRKGRAHFANEEISEEISERISSEQKRFEFKKMIETEIAGKYDESKITTFFPALNSENEFDVKKGIILIADDNANIRAIILEYLKNNGFQNFILVGNGLQAVEAAYQYRPDLIICDYNMPLMRGDQFHDELAGNPDFKHIPFIFLSAVLDRNIIFERKSKGALAYLSKPVEESDLLLTVDLHMNKYMDLKTTLYLATIDELTGVNTKRNETKLLKNQLSIRRLREISLIFFDLDHFKKVNDTYGHPVGDRILALVGKVIRETIRRYDIAGRFGGDEFIIALPETDSANALVVAEKLRKRIKESEINVEGINLIVTASFGISSLLGNGKRICSDLGISDLKAFFEVAPGPQVDWEEIEKKKIQIPDILIALADKALYEAKRTSCPKCGFHSEKEKAFSENRCPECGSIKLLQGRDRSIVFREERGS